MYAVWTPALSCPFFFVLCCLCHFIGSKACPAFPPAPKLSSVTPTPTLPLPLSPLSSLPYATLFFHPLIFTSFLIAHPSVWFCFYLYFNSGCRYHGHRHQGDQRYVTFTATTTATRTLLSEYRFRGFGCCARIRTAPEQAPEQLLRELQQHLQQSR